MQTTVRIVTPPTSNWRTLAVLLVLIASASVSSVFAQVRFEVPLYVTDGVERDTLYFGIVPGANFCVVASDSINGRSEFFLPPEPPAGVFEGRFKWPRTGTNLPCFDQGTAQDYRPFTIAAQRDTFRIKCQVGAGTTMNVSWPANLNTRFTGLTIRYFDGSGNVNTNMLTNTSVFITDAGDPAIANIYSGGLVPTSVEEIAPGIPQEFALNQNYPNPFNPTTTIQFSVAQSAMTDISVFDVLGKKVATLAAEVMKPGYYKVTWDGMNNVGNSVASGVYFVRMSAQAENGTGFSAMRKLLFVK